jgi:hypothetical protein
MAGAPNTALTVATNVASGPVSAPLPVSTGAASGPASAPVPVQNLDPAPYSYNRGVVAVSCRDIIGVSDVAATTGGSLLVFAVYVQSGLMYVVTHGADVSDAQTSMESARADFVERCIGKNMWFVAPNSGYQVPIHTTIGDMGGHIVSLTGPDSYLIKE